MQVSPAQVSTQRASVKLAFGLHTSSAAQGFGSHGSSTQGPALHVLPVLQGKKQQSVVGLTAARAGPFSTQPFPVPQMLARHGPWHSRPPSHTHTAGRSPGVSPSGRTRPHPSPGLRRLLRAVPAGVVHAELRHFARAALLHRLAQRASGQISPLHGVAHWQTPAATSTQVLPGLQIGSEPAASVSPVLSICPSQSLSLQSQVSGWRPDAVGAADLAGVAAELALLALADVDAAGVADLLEVGSEGLAVPSMPSGGGAGLVDRAVAVVVLAVADLRARADAAAADGPAAALRVARADAGLALALVAVARVEHWSYVDRAQGPPRPRPSSTMPLQSLSLPSQISGGRAHAARQAIAADAAVVPGEQAPEWSAAGQADARDAVVDLAVAVVVDAVADLGRSGSCRRCTSSR